MMPASVADQQIAEPSYSFDSTTRMVRVSAPPRAAAKLWIACGMFLVVLGVYVLTSPGRIDIIDGQARFDVAYNWLVNGRPIMRDNWIASFMGVTGRDGFRYSYYGAPGSVFGIPLVWLGLHLNPAAIQPSQFLFSLTSSILGAAIAPLLFVFYLELGVSLLRAFVWTAVSSFATYIWPISNSTFDNAQHAFFVIAALYFGYLGARRKSHFLAAIAGLFTGVLILYQEYFLLIIPALAFSTVDLDCQRQETHPISASQARSIVRRAHHALQRRAHNMCFLVREAWAGPGDARASCTRYLAFVAAATVGLGLTFAYKDLRFGSLFYDGKAQLAAQRNEPVFGNPVAGLLTVLVSPGKGIFLYSPPLVLAMLGIRGLRRRASGLFLTIAATSAILLCFICCLAFASGDWCWGPRYLTLLLPLWALVFPFVDTLKLRRGVAVAVIGTGVLVQALALSVENQRFFFERGLNDFFWAEDSWFYFKHSALFARVGEAVSLNQPLPPTAQWFSSTPVPEWTTYSILGPPFARSLAPVWMRNFKIYYLPRPWPLWMPYLPPSQRPVNVGLCLLGVLGVTTLGIGAIYRGFRLEASA